MAEVFNSNMGEVCDEYIYYVCDNGEKARSVIIIDSGCSARMLSDWRVHCTFRSKTGIQVKSANRQLIEASSVVSVVILITYCWCLNSEEPSSLGRN